MNAIFKKILSVIITLISVFIICEVFLFFVTGMIVFINKEYSFLDIFLDTRVQTVFVLLTLTITGIIHTKE